jgi:V/A-type H+-transporting ATPase subunit C
MPVARNDTYLDTRVAILRSRLLSPGELEDLAVNPSDSTMAARLNLAEPPSELDTATIERATMHALLADLAVILRPLTDEARDFFTFWARRFELFNLKALIRGKLGNLPDAEIERHLQDMPSFTVLQHDRLLRTESVAELLRQIEAGPYGDIARQARLVFEEKPDTLAVEAAIDQRYYAGLVKRVHRLPKAEKEATHRLMGMQVDRINLSWLVRYRFAYQLSPSETYYYLIRHGLYLKRDQLLRLVEMDSLEAVLADLPEALRERLGDARHALEVERGLEDMVIEYARQIMHKNHPALTKALAYLLLRECELHRLYAVYQGQRLGIDPELISAATGRGKTEFH